jgi:hypothetical protein
MTVLGDIVIGVTANLIQVPKSYYAIPVGATLAIILITAKVKSSKDDASYRRPHPNFLQKTINTERDTLRGVHFLPLLAGTISSSFTVPIGVMTYEGYNGLLPGQHVPPNSTGGIIVMTFGFAIFAIFAIFATSILLSPASLVFSSDGITVKYFARHRHIRWDEATDFRVIEWEISFSVVDQSSTRQTSNACRLTNKAIDLISTGMEI